MERIGVVKSLMDEETGKKWEKLFWLLGYEVVGAGSATGTDMEMEEACPPVRDALLEAQSFLARHVDHVFFPRMAASESGCINCPGMQSVRDRLRPFCAPGVLLDPILDVKPRCALRSLGRMLGIPYGAVRRVWDLADEASGRAAV